MLAIRATICASFNSYQPSDWICASSNPYEPLDQIRDVSCPISFFHLSPFVCLYSLSVSEWCQMLLERFPMIGMMRSYQSHLAT